MNYLSSGSFCNVSWPLIGQSSWTCYRYVQWILLFLRISFNHRGPHFPVSNKLFGSSLSPRINMATNCEEGDQIFYKGLTSASFEYHWAHFYFLASLYPCIFAPSAIYIYKWFTPEHLSAAISQSFCLLCMEHEEMRMMSHSGFGQTDRRTIFHDR